MKRLLSLLVSLTMFLAISAPAYAYNSKTTAAIDSCTAVTSARTQALPHNIRSLNLNDIGDTGILMEDEEGTLYVELIDKHKTVSNDSSRGVYRVTTAADYELSYKNFLGLKKTIIVVSAYAEWIDDGFNSEITNLHFEYSLKDTAFSCIWNEDETTAEKAFHYVVLELYNKGTYYCPIILSAGLYFTEDGPDVNLVIGSKG